MNDTVEIERLRQQYLEYRAKVGEELAQMIEGITPSDIRLAAGEMTAQEMRTVRAIQKWLAVKIRNRVKIDG